MLDSFLASEGEGAGADWDLALGSFPRDAEWEMMKQRETDTTKR